jgi:IclR family pca regulon transcriptional regulator
MKRTAFDRSTINRILRSFIDANYVERSGRGEYTISTRGYLLGVHLTHAHNLVRVAQPELNDLQNRVGETVNLGVLTGPEVVYLIRMAVGRMLSLNIDVGSRLPAYCSAFGRAILAFLPTVEALAVLQHSDRRQYTPYTKTSIEDLWGVLNQIRRSRFVVTHQELIVKSPELEMDMFSMACPVFIRGGRPIAAINIAFSAETRTATQLIQRYRDPLLKTCERISFALGWNGAISAN